MNKMATKISARPAKPPTIPPTNACVRGVIPPPDEPKLALEVGVGAPVVPDAPPDAPGIMPTTPVAEDVSVVLEEET